MFQHQVKSLAAIGIQWRKCRLETEAISLFRYLTTDKDYQNYNQENTETQISSHIEDQY